MIPGCPCIIIPEPLFDRAGVRIEKQNGKFVLEKSNGETMMSGRLNRKNQYEMAVQPVHKSSVSIIAQSTEGTDTTTKSMWLPGFCTKLRLIGAYGMSLFGKKSESADSPF